MSDTDISFVTKLFEKYFRTNPEDMEEDVLDALDRVARGEADVSKEALCNLLQRDIEDVVLGRAIQIVATHTPWGPEYFERLLFFINNNIEGSDAALYSFLAICNIWHSLTDAQKNEAVASSIMFIDNSKGNMVERKAAYRILLLSQLRYSEYKSLTAFVDDWCYDPDVLSHARIDK